MTLGVKSWSNTTDNSWNSFFSKDLNENIDTTIGCKVNMRLQKELLSLALKLEQDEPASMVLSENAMHLKTQWVNVLPKILFLQ